MPAPVPPCLAAAFEYLRRGWSALPLCPADHEGVSGRHEQQCRRRPANRHGICRGHREEEPRQGARNTGRADESHHHADGCHRQLSTVPSWAGRSKWLGREA